MNRGLWFWVALCFVVFSSAQAADPSSNQTRIKLLVTSDMHGWLSTKLLYPKKRAKGLSHLEHFIKAAKKRDPETILLDGGDAMEGSALAHYHHFERKGTSRISPFLHKMNELGYDAAAIGNHDLQLNPLFEKLLLPSSGFTWLAANLTKDGKPAYSAYKILHRKGLKIAVLGFTTPGSKMWLAKEQLEGLHIEDLAISVPKWVDRIKKSEKPDLLIGLFHVGQNALKDDEAAKLNQIPKVNPLNEILLQNTEFDLVIHGHEHRLQPRKSGEPPLWVGSTPVVAAGHWAEALIELDLVVEKKESANRITQFMTKIHPADQDPKIARSYHANLSKEYLDYLFAPLPFIIGPADKATASDCLNRLLSAAATQNQVGGSLLPMIRIKKIKSLRGKRLDRADLFRWIPYDNKGVLIALSPKQIQLLTDPKPYFGTGRVPSNRKLFNGIPGDLKPRPEKSWFLNSEKFAKNSKILLADYHINGGGGLAALSFIKEEDILERSPGFLRNQLFDYLSHQTKLEVPSCAFLKPVE